MNRLGLWVASRRILLLLAVAIAPSQPALAQADGEARAPTESIILRKLSIVKIKDLDFGRIVNTGGGTVVLNALENETCTITGNLIHVGTCQAAEFVGAGTTGERIRIRKPQGRRIILTGPGPDLRITNVTFGYTEGLNRLTARTNSRAVRYRINDPDGVFTVKLGGTLTIPANQPDGRYTGTFQVDTDYR